MSAKRWWLVTAGLMTAGALFGLLDLWWWALFGLRPELGMALGATAALLAIVGWLCGLSVIGAEGREAS